MRVFPISNWTEMDIWQYIEREGIELPSIYFAHQRKVFERDGMLMAVSPSSSSSTTKRHSRPPFVSALSATCRAPAHSSRRPAPSKRSSPRSPRPGSPNVAPPGPTISPPRPLWKTASGRATSNVELVRLATTGSVDDGKSTLIGRMLYDTKQIFQDQLDAIEEALARTAAPTTSTLRLLTDGLRAEREQGITIDVAYRYFATPKRKFILADTPGHIQYTRNMVTGASTADIALVLVDARNGILEQTRRHSFIASLLRVPHLVLCVNKMDLVDYSEDRLRRIVDEFTASPPGSTSTICASCPCRRSTATTRQRSTNMPWYHGPPLLHHPGEHPRRVRSQPDRCAVPGAVRDPSPHRWSTRTTAAMPARSPAGCFKPGDEVDGPAVRVRDQRSLAIDTFDGPVEEARRRCR